MSPPHTGELMQHLYHFISQKCTVPEIRNILPGLMTMKIDYNDRTLLHILCEKEHEDYTLYYIAQQFCDYDAWLNQDKFQKTPLHYAAMHKKSPKIIDTLNASKIKQQTLDIKDAQGNKPIHILCANNPEPLFMDMILQHMNGYTIPNKNKDKKSPADIINENVTDMELKTQLNNMLTMYSKYYKQKIETLVASTDDLKDIDILKEIEDFTEKQAKNKKRTKLDGGKKKKK